ncbi:hypothetical protein LCGC14_0978090 [marine sediment metagenome]|uniref:Uncharacterized protein n=1 Tax=marine sediment metagenome TaxID=412755 RepID=A0A0F9QSX7_9ZZZZ
MKAKCPCCGNEVTVKYVPAKWQNQTPRVVVTHNKWGR